MTLTRTFTETYTKVDVRKVFEAFRADLRMAAASSLAMHLDEADRTAADVAAFAEADYLSKVHVMLRHNGERLEAKSYEVVTFRGVSGLSPDRPGNMIWPRCPKGHLNVVVQHNDSWRTLGEDQKQAFKGSLNGSWGPSSEDLTFADLTTVEDRNFLSRAYGLRGTRRTRR